MDNSIPPGKKRCTKCRQIKDINEFGRARIVKDGHRGECKECAKKGRKYQCRECKERKRKEDLIIGRYRNYYYCIPCWEALQGKKKCIGCKMIKDLQEFAEDKSRPDGHEYYCKDCRREHQIKKHAKKILQRGEKQCIRCRKIKDINEFFENHTTRDKIDLYCKQCRAEAKTTSEQEKDTTREYRELAINGQKVRKLRSFYGITEDDYRRLYEQQKGLCAI